MRQVPYVADPETGRSVTREFVEQFLLAYTNRVYDKCGHKIYSGVPIFERIYDGSRDVDPSINTTDSGRTRYTSQCSLCRHDVGTHYLENHGCSKCADHHSIKQAYIKPNPTLHNGTNKDEFLWVLKIDIANAIRTLSYPIRLAMTYEYIYNYSPETCAEMCGIQERMFQYRISNGLDRITAILDGTT